MDQEINKLVSEIKGKSCKGSSLRSGRMYHGLPFKEFRRLPSHRHYTTQRWNQIAPYINKGSSIVDFGCNVGGLSLLAAYNGASMVVGIDYDEQSIAVARLVADKKNITNVEFRVQKIDAELIDKLENFDVAIWFSNWMWIARQQGINEARRLLYNVSTKCGSMLFESDATDHKGGIPGMTQEKLEQLLKVTTCYKKVTNIAVTPNWYGRIVYYCTDGQTKFNGLTANVERISHDVVRKTFLKKYHFLMRREFEALSRLNPYNHFPKIVDYGTDYIDMTYCGVQADNPDKEQCMEILSALKEARINNKDIRPDHLFVKDGTVYLIDLGCCMFDDEINPPVHLPRIRGKLTMDEAMEWSCQS
jgi:SAM-dependent methyltransferase